MDTAKQELLGHGRRRACYRIGDTGKCLKCYLPEELIDGEGTIAREIRKLRFNRKLNTCAQEYDYYRKLRARLPAGLMAVFPEEMELVDDPVRGWCLEETELRNFDGSPLEDFASACRRGGEAKVFALVAAFKQLMQDLARYRVRFFDPPNVLVQTVAPNGDFRLRIVDFEPASRTLVPLDRMFPILVGVKLLRRARRFLKCQLGIAEW